MARHSFTFVSRLALAALFVAPVAAGELWLVPRFSGRAREVAAARREQTAAGSDAKSFVLFGDSTARRLRVTAAGRGGDAERGPLLDLGLGGSMVPDWLAFCESVRRGHARFRSAAVFAVAEAYANNPDPGDAPYGAYLVSGAEILQLWRSGELRLPDAARFLAARALHLYSDRRDVLYELLAGDPDLHPWAEEFLLRQSQKMAAPAAPGAAPEPPRGWHWRYRLRQCLGLAADRVFLLLSPLSSGMRSRPGHARAVAGFHALCRGPGLTCLSFETAFPDAAFETDLVHVRAEFQPDLLRKIETALGSPEGTVK